MSLAAGAILALSGLLPGEVSAQNSANSQLVGRDVVGSAQRFVQLVIHDGFSVLAEDGDADTRRGALSAVFDGAFAGAEIGRLALGDQWASAAPAAQTRFIAALGDHFADLISSSLPMGRFQIFDASDAGVSDLGDPMAEVVTVFVGDNASTRVVWTVVAIDDHLKVQDITFGRRSLLESQRDSFAAILARNGGSLEELIAEIAG